MNAEWIQGHPRRTVKTGGPNRRACGVLAVDMKTRDRSSSRLSDGDSAQRFYTASGGPARRQTYAAAEDFWRHPVSRRPGSGCSVIFRQERHRGVARFGRGLYLIVGGPRWHRPGAELRRRAASKVSGTSVHDALVSTPGRDEGPKSVGRKSGFAARIAASQLTQALPRQRSDRQMAGCCKEIIRARFARPRFESRHTLPRPGGGGLAAGSCAREGRSAPAHLA